MESVVTSPLNSATSIQHHFGATTKDPIIKINMSIIKAGQWGIWKMKIVTNLTTSESGILCMLWLVPWGKGEMTTTPSPSGPLTSYCVGTEATCWGFWAQFAVFPCWTPPDALSLLQHDLIFLWTARSPPVDQQGLSDPAAIEWQKKKVVTVLIWVEGILPSV